MNPITRTDHLAEVCKRLATHEFVTVDTEFVRQNTFWPILCLIQMASPDEAVSVDALSKGINLSPFFDLMKNENVLKVFHSARQDIEIIVNLANLIPKPIFDTQIAGMVCGFGNSISYEKIVSTITGKAVDKSVQFTDWSRRPLTEKQLNYALSDVTHLRDVYLHLNAELDRLQRNQWIQDEMNILTKFETYVTPPEEAWKRLKNRNRKPVEFAILKELASWRELRARELDKTRKFILNDDAIYEIAHQQPTDKASLAELRRVTMGFANSKSATEILEIVNRVKSIQPDQFPTKEIERKNAKPAPELIDLLKILLKTVCQMHDVAPKLVASVEDLERIAAETNPQVNALTGWRKKLFGDLALKLKNGEIMLGYKDEKLTIIPKDS